VLGLAGLLFFRYSIEHGLITPPMRVVLGTLAGLGCLGAAQWIRPRGYAYTAEAISGAGVIILYASFWAAHVRYALIGAVPAYGLMVLVTIACGLLAVRHASLVVAVLGLTGGFATPLLLSSGTDRPLGLFSYVLLLDLGLFAVARRRGWPILGLLGLAGTVVLEGLWIFVRMGPDRLGLGLVVLGVFALLFALAGRLVPVEGPRLQAFSTQAAAVLFPFVFAIYFATHAEIGERLWPIALLMAMLGAAAAFIARDREAASVALGAAAATVAVTGAWVLQHATHGARAWELAAVCIVLAALHHTFCERDPGAAPGPALPALIVVLGMFAALLVAAVGAATAPWPWIAGWTALAVLAYRQAAITGRAILRPVATLGIAGGLTLLHGVHSSAVYFPATPLFLLLLVAAPLAAHAAALAVRDGEEALADEATIGLASLLSLGLVPARFAHELGPVPGLGTLLLIGLIGVLGATRRGQGLAYALPVATTWLAQSAWVVARKAFDGQLATARTAFALVAATVVIFTIWPFATSSRFSRDRIAWYTAALAGPCWFLALRRSFVGSFGDAAIGLLPLALGALALAAVARARGTWPAGDPLRHTALVWFGAIALSFAALAVPLQLEREWVTIGWALQGAAILLLWQRLDHPGLKYFALALFAAVTVRLVANPALLGYYPRSDVRIVNWLLYTYFVPTAGLLAGARILASLETGRARDWEEPVYRKGRPVGAIAAAGAAIAVVFVWINLAIADWFTTGTRLTLSFGERPSQRLAVSIAWALYALLLLGIGLARVVRGLRWISLALLLVTLIKVFLYDLGTLRDLYLVGALLGLAVSLILVSLAYQRFVFRDRRAERV
jgi:uncharacterized membrane protein